MKNKIVVTALLLTASMLANADIGNTATQQTCTQTGIESSPVAPTFNLAWRDAGLNRSIDDKILHRDIVAYKIRWSTGWSDWIVKGVNDLYSFTTPSAPPAPPFAVDARLTWIYFFDHPHLYISCKDL